MYEGPSAEQEEHRKGDVWEREGVRYPVRSSYWTIIGTYLEFGPPLNAREVETMKQDGWKRLPRE